jgi:hypothetical protein
MKKFLIPILIIGAAVAAYFFFFRKKSKTTSILGGSVSSKVTENIPKTGTTYIPPIPYSKSTQPVIESFTNILSPKIQQVIKQPIIVPPELAELQVEHISELRGAIKPGMNQDELAAIFKKGKYMT